MSEPKEPGVPPTIPVIPPTDDHPAGPHGLDQALRTAATTWPVAPERRARHAGIRSRDVFKVAAILLLIYISARLVWSAYALAILAFLGVLFGLAISRAVEPLVRLRVPRGVAAGVVVLSVIGVLGSITAWSAPILVREFADLRTKLPQAIDAVDSWIESRRDGMLGPIISQLEKPPASGAVPPVDTSTYVAARDASAAIPAPPAQLSSADSAALRKSGVAQQLVARLITSGQRYLFPLISSAFTVVAATLLIIMLSIYVAADPGLYHRGVMHLVPHKQRARTGEVLSRMATVLRRWLGAQLIGMFVIGIVTTAALYLLGIPAALPLGILAGLLEFIPNVGPIIAAAPALLMGFMVSPEKALWVLIAYVVIQQLESQILIPIIMKEGLDLPPVLTILAQALMAIVFGFLGLLIAVPLLAIVMVAVKMLYVEGVVGDVIDDEEEVLA